MFPQNERDFPKGHPKAADYDPSSPEAQEWHRLNVHPRGERDWPVGHPKAVDTPGNTNAVPTLPGIDPQHPDLEPFTGRTPAQAAAARALDAEAAKTAQPSPVVKPGLAPDPDQIRARVQALVAEGNTPEQANGIAVREMYEQMLATATK